MKNDLPYMRYYGRDYWDATKKLTWEQHGVYHRLIWLMWEEGGSLPDDDQFIARMLGVPTLKWRHWKKALAPHLKFSTATDGSKTLCQTRLKTELGLALGLAAKHSAKSAKGGMAKARKAKEIQQALAGIGNGTGNASGRPRKLPQAMPQGVPIHIKNITTISNNPAREEEGETSPAQAGVAAAPDGAAPPADQEPGKEASAKTTFNPDHPLLQTATIRRGALKS